MAGACSSRSSGTSTTSSRGGIFNRAFIRQYARQVGLDGEWGVGLYERARYRAGEDERAARRAGVRAEIVVLAVGVILALLLGVTFWYFWHPSKP
ncbi:MAG: hypothetical protein U0166_14105 [Acidobacteriota bacterium]